MLLVLKNTQENILHATSRKFKHKDDMKSLKHLKWTNIFNSQLTGSLNSTVRPMTQKFIPGARSHHNSDNCNLLTYSGNSKQRTSCLQLTQVLSKLIRDNRTSTPVAAHIFALLLVKTYVFFSTRTNLSDVLKAVCFHDPPPTPPPHPAPRDENKTGSPSPHLAVWLFTMNSPDVGVGTANTARSMKMTSSLQHPDHQNNST